MTSGSRVLALGHQAAVSFCPCHSASFNNGSRYNTKDDNYSNVISSENDSHSDAQVPCSPVLNTLFHLKLLQWPPLVLRGLQALLTDPSLPL